MSLNEGLLGEGSQSLGEGSQSAASDAAGKGGASKVGVMARTAVENPTQSHPQASQEPARNADIVRNPTVDSRVHPATAWPTESVCAFAVALSVVDPHRPQR